MAAKKQKWTQKLGSVLPMVLMVLAGAAVGYFGADYLFPRAEAAGSLGEYLMELGTLLLALAGAVYLHTILHEAGHLVFGLASGYRFVSFRIGSLMWQKDGETLRFCRFTLAGTAGQCLMAPPDLTDGKMPYKLYNMGGAFMNLITAVLAVGLAAVSGEHELLRTFWEMMALIGVATALINGIPMQVGGVANDGRNALLLGKDPAAMRAIWIQLKINEQQAQGKALRQMPEEWFALPTEGMDDPLVAALAVLRENRFMEQHCFEQAAGLIDTLESQPNGILPIHRNTMFCDRLTCALLTGEETARLMECWNGKEMRAFRNQMASFLTVLRTEYIVALLQKRHGQAAERILAKFEKRAKRYPMKADVETERALMALAAQRAAKL